MAVHALHPLNLPYGSTQLINKMLADPRCTTDHILLTADALDEIAQELREESDFVPALRRIAPDYAQPRGKPHGDFDGSLTP